MITLLTLLSVTTAEEQELIGIPQPPNIEALQDVGIGRFILNGGVFFVDIIIFLFALIGFTLTALIPFWLNIIIFGPIVSFIIYEVIARIIRGS